MTKKFITQELRDAIGQCQIVSDATMQNLGIDRMGFCQACNHEIKNHLGIYHPTIGYLYVGACCKQILCNPDLPVIIPNSGTNFTDAKGNNRVVLSFDDYKKLGDYIFVVGEVRGSFGDKWISSVENNWNGAWYTAKHNTFLANMLYAMQESKKYNGFYSLSEKQYNCIKSIIG